MRAAATFPALEASAPMLVGWGGGGVTGFGFTMHAVAPYWILSVLSLGTTCCSVNSDSGLVPYSARMYLRKTRR